MAKGVKTGGRKKGTPNKFPRTVKESIFEVYERLGSVDGFHAWAVSNPDEFYKNYFKLAPKEVEVSGPSGGAIPGEFVIKFIKPE